MSLDRSNTDSPLPTAPRVSIGMPVYNGARYLTAAIDSLLAQTFTDFELIISDNASTDATGEICQQYATRDARIRYVQQPENRGAAWNFNHVFELARAPYFKWAAADDVCHPEFLARCVEVLDREPTVVCCHTRTRKIDAIGDRIEQADDPTDGGLPSDWFTRLDGERPHRPDASSPIAHRRFGDVLLYSGWAVRCSGVIRSDVLRQTTLIQPNYGYEKVTMAELALRGRFHDVPETLFFQRVHGEASCQLKSADEKQRFFATQSRPRRSSGRLLLLRGYLRAVSRSPLGTRERWRCRLWILRYLFQVQKWWPVLRSAVPSRGARFQRATFHKLASNKP